MPYLKVLMWTHSPAKTICNLHQINNDLYQTPGRLSRLIIVLSKYLRKI